MMSLVHGYVLQGVGLVLLATLVLGLPAEGRAQAPRSDEHAARTEPGATIVGCAPSDGAVGFGAGLDTSVDSLFSFGSSVALKWWFAEQWAFMPAATLYLDLAEEYQEAYQLAPSVQFEHSLVVGRTTRLNLRFGLGGELLQKGEGGGTELAAVIPFGLAVEHFFFEWFSVELGTRMNLVGFSTSQDGWGATFGFDSAALAASVFLYTD